jgi:multidrug efflux system membrane fusion protein
MIRPLAVAASATLALTACGKGADATRGRGPVPVRSALAEVRAVPSEVRAVGRIVSNRSVSVRAQVSGQLTAARFAEGQAVEAGDVLVEIDRRPFEAALAEARAALARDLARAENARADAARYEELAAKEYVTRQQAEAALAGAAALDATVEGDRAAVRRAELSLAWCTIRAPVAGRTGRLLVHPGNLVTAGSQEIVTLQQLQPVYVSFAVPARYLAELRARATPAPVQVQLARGSPSVAGVVEFVDNAVDEASGTILLKARVPNQDEALWPGQVVEVALQLAAPRPAVMVPASAVQQGQRGDYAFVVKDGAAELRQVTVAQADEREVAIAEGIAAGERVVVEGQLKLVPGARVELLDGEAGPR